MKIEKFSFPKSSFLSVPKDLALIVDKICKNDNLKKLLYYNTKDCYNRPKLTDEQTQELMNKNILIVPKLYVDPEALVYLMIHLDNFSPTTNTEFRDNMVEFDIICHFDSWNLGDFKLRPFMIASELDSMFNKSRLTGIGLLEFAGCSEMVLNDEFAGLCLRYYTWHGEDDKIHPLNPADQQNLVENFEGWRYDEE